MANDELLIYAVKAAVMAGDEILKVYVSDFSVELKDDNSPLTFADKKSHETIIKELAETYLPVLSEEGKEILYDERKNWPLLWIIDPLDGTKEFVKRNGEFTVNIALVENGKPILGVVYAPVKKVLYFAGKGAGAFRYHLPSISERSPSDRYQEMEIDKLIKSSEKLPVRQKTHKFTIVASRSHLTKETDDFISKMKKEHGDINLISAGSSLKICLVAEGAADVYPRFGPTMEWDTAAGQAIVDGAGKKLIDVTTNQPMIYNRENLKNNSFIVQ